MQSFQQKQFIVSPNLKSSTIRRTKKTRNEEYKVNLTGVNQPQNTGSNLFQNTKVQQKVRASVQDPLEIKHNDHFGKTAMLFNAVSCDLTNNISNSAEPYSRGKKNQLALTADKKNRSSLESCNKQYMGFNQNKTYQHTEYDVKLGSVVFKNDFTQSNNQTMQLSKIKQQGIFPKSRYADNHVDNVVHQLQSQSIDRPINGTTMMKQRPPVGKESITSRVKNIIQPSRPHGHISLSASQQKRNAQILRKQNFTQSSVPPGQIQTQYGPKAIIVQQADIDKITQLNTQKFKDHIIVQDNRRGFTQSVNRSQSQAGHSNELNCTYPGAGQISQINSRFKPQTCEIDQSSLSYSQNTPNIFQPQQIQQMGGKENTAFVKRGDHQFQKNGSFLEQESFEAPTNGYAQDMRQQEILNHQNQKRIMQAESLNLSRSNATDGSKLCRTPNMTGPISISTIISKSEMGQHIDDSGDLTPGISRRNPTEQRFNRVSIEKQNKKHRLQQQHVKIKCQPQNQSQNQKQSVELDKIDNKDGSFIHHHFDTGKNVNLRQMTEDRRFFQTQKMDFNTLKNCFDRNMERIQKLQSTDSNLKQLKTLKPPSFAFAATQQNNSSQAQKKTPDKNKSPSYHVSMQVRQGPTPKPEEPQEAVKTSQAQVQLPPNLERSVEMTPILIQHSVGHHTASKNQDSYHQNSWAEAATTEHLSKNGGTEFDDFCIDKTEISPRMNKTLNGARIIPTTAEGKRQIDSNVLIIMHENGEHRKIVRQLQSSQNVNICPEQLYQLEQQKLRKMKKSFYPEPQVISSKRTSTTQKHRPNSSDMVRSDDFDKQTQNQKMSSCYEYGDNSTESKKTSQQKPRHTNEASQKIKNNKSKPQLPSPELSLDKSSRRSTKRSRPSIAAQQASKEQPNIPPNKRYKAEIETTATTTSSLKMNGTNLHSKSRTGISTKMSKNKSSLMKQQPQPMSVYPSSQGLHGVPSLTQVESKPCSQKQIQAQTPTKAGTTYRLFFKRRERMAQQNLIIIYFDGVLGDIYSKVQNLNHFRLRYGVLQGLARLAQKNQIAILVPYSKKRAKVIASYLTGKPPKGSGISGPVVDAVYSLRRRKLASGDLRFINYEQIYSDFQLSHDENELMSKTLIFATRTQDTPIEEQEQQPEDDVPQTNFDILKEDWRNTRRIVCAEDYDDENINWHVNFAESDPGKLTSFDQQTLPHNARFNMKVLGCPTFLASAKEKETGQRKHQIKIDSVENKPANHVHPVCMFVPHTKLFPSSNQVGSFLHISRVVEQLSVTHSQLYGQNGDITIDRMDSSRDLYQQPQKSQRKNRKKSRHVSERNISTLPKAFNVLDTFYIFKQGLHQQQDTDQEIEAAPFLALETKQLHMDILRELNVLRALEQQALAKKCYLNRRTQKPTSTSRPSQLVQAAQNSFEMVALQDICNTTTFRSLTSQNEHIRTRALGAYRKAYYQQLDECQMTAEDKNRKAEIFGERAFIQQLKMKLNEVVCLPVVPQTATQLLQNGFPGMNFYQSHRFLFMKTGGIPQDQPLTGIKQGGVQQKVLYPMEQVDFVRDIANGDVKSLAPDLENILAKTVFQSSIKKKQGTANRYDILGWLSKKAVAKIPTAHVPIEASRPTDKVLNNNAINSDINQHLIAKNCALATASAPAPPQKISQALI